MISHSLRRTLTTALTATALAFTLVGGQAARAQNYSVSIDTSHLTSGDSYALDFQLNQGDSGASSKVDINDFSYGGGSAAGDDTIYSSGNTAGDLASGVSLLASDASPFNEFSQNFTTGSSVKFQVDASGLAANTGTTPTQFIFDLFDNTTGTSVPSSDNAGGNISLFTLTRDGGGSYLPVGFGYTGTDNQPVSTSISIAPVPELSSFTLFALLIGGLGLMRLTRRTRKQRASA